MITSSILMVVLKIVSPLVSLFKPINVLVNSTFISYVFDVVSGVLYFLPVGTINTILGITLATWVIRVVIAFLRALWGILPIV